MARLYADKQFPRIVSQLLRNMGHDILSHRLKSGAIQTKPACAGLT
jgi:hypothetical protein